MRFPLAAAYRGLDQMRQADSLYQIQGRNSRNAWWKCVQTELRRNDPQGRAVKLRLACVKTAAVPRLDGRLNDPVWRQAKQVALHSAQNDDADWPAVAMMAYDAEFLYLAVRCRTVATARAVADEKPSPKKLLESSRLSPASSVQTQDTADDRRRPRPRDGDLSAHDRVEIFLDIDRDYAVYYHLAVDDRGWTNDRCWDDATWNPKWYVAVGREEGAWTIEAAIPLGELTDRPPQSGEIWGLGIQSRCARRGVSIVDRAGGRLRAARRFRLSDF